MEVVLRERDGGTRTERTIRCQPSPLNRYVPIQISSTDPPFHIYRQLFRESTLLRVISGCVYLPGVPRRQNEPAVGKVTQRRDLSSQQAVWQSQLRKHCEPVAPVHLQSPLPHWRFMSLSRTPSEAGAMSGSAGAARTIALRVASQTMESFILSCSGEGV